MIFTSIVLEVNDVLLRKFETLLFQVMNIDPKAPELRLPIEMNSLVLAIFR